MNNKGQVLVGFVLLLPFLVMLIAYVIDNGALLDAKTRLDEVSKSAIIYGLETSASEDEIKTYITKNEENLDLVEIEITDTISIKLTKTQNGIFSKIIGIDSYTIFSNYEGRMENGEMKLKKIEE